MMNEANQGVGARLPRKEDDRFMRGRGRFVADIKPAGVREVAFIRSPLAHARIRGVRVPEDIRDRVFLSNDLNDVQPIKAVSALPGFKSSVQPVVAGDKVRHVGEIVGICVADTRAEAEDLVARVEVDYEELPAIHDMLQAREEGAAIIHDEWGDNVFLESFVDVGGDIWRSRRVRPSRSSENSGQHGNAWRRLKVVVLLRSGIHGLSNSSSTVRRQMPHIVRSGMAECLGLDHGRIRIIAPDVGGGFGYKGILLAEEVALGWLARRLRRPVRWIEDRREHLIGNANCREHHYKITGYADADGRLIGLEAEAHVDSGAYSAYPFSACPRIRAGWQHLAGAIRFRSVPLPDLVFLYEQATNLFLPWRGADGVCFAMELVLDAIAQKPAKSRIKCD